MKCCSLLLLNFTIVCRGGFCLSIANVFGFESIFQVRCQLIMETVIFFTISGDNAYITRKSNLTLILISLCGYYHDIDKQFDKRFMQVSISSITIPPRTPKDLQKFAPTLGLLYPSFCPGAGICRGSSRGMGICL